MQQYTLKNDSKAKRAIVMIIMIKLIDDMQGGFIDSNMNLEFNIYVAVM